VRGHEGLAPSPSPEGLYLPGYGYVFTLTLPAGIYQPLSGPAKPGPKPLSQWAKVRNELHGVKAKPDEAKAAPAEPALADVVLRLLADNGRHFSLPENQQVTVAVTLRPMGAQSCIACHTASIPPMGGGGGSGGADRGGPAADNTAAQAPAPKGGSAAPDLNASVFLNQVDLKDADARKVEASNLTHLGDLRLRQGRTQEAIDAYRKAIELYGKLPDWKQRVASGDKEGKQYVTDVAEAYTKIAQAYLMLGQTDQAVDTLRRAQLYWTRVAATGGNVGGPSKAADAAPAALPEKLVISASRQMLDEVASGKLSFEDFKKRATVEHLTFPAKSGGGAKP
jgi:tetratricopeptide (TPR) repeat protein